jgi:hypothetical protein
MGGFATFEGNDVHHIVTAKDLKDLLKNGKINITEMEIRDKGRGDALSKGLVLIQTTWFILQYIARKVTHLPITELELVTLAFAALNFVTYAVWWYKPLNVQCPVRVYRQGKKDNGDGEVSSGTGGNRDAEAEEAGKSEEESESIWSMIATDIKMPITNTKTPGPIGKAMAKIGHTVQSYVHEYRWYVIWHGLAGVLAAVMVVAVVSPLLALLSVLGPLAGLTYVIGISWRLAGNFTFLDENDNVIDEGAKEVPTFHAGPKSIGHEAEVVGFAACVIAMVFGSVHLVGWSFAFPSYTEQHLWRIASISITSAPLSIMVTIILSSMNAPVWITLTWRCISMAASLLYLIGQLTLLVLPFMSLRSLPAEVYQTVQWTTFIPHV